MQYHDYHWNQKVCMILKEESVKTNDWPNSAGPWTNVFLRYSEGDTEHISLSRGMCLMISVGPSTCYTLSSSGSTSAQFGVFPFKVINWDNGLSSIKGIYWIKGKV